MDLVWLSFNSKLKVLLFFLDPLCDDSTGRKVQAQNPSFFSKIQLPSDINGLHLRWLEDSSKCQFTKASLGQFCSFSSWGLLVIQGWLKVNVQIDSCCSKNFGQEGAVSIVVATSVLAEGIDVPSCGLVLCSMAALGEFRGWVFSKGTSGSRPPISNFHPFLRLWSSSVTLATCTT